MSNIAEALASLSKDESRAYLISEFSKIYGNFSQEPETPIMQLIEILSSASETMRQSMISVYQSISWLTASGEALNNRAEEVGLMRKHNENDEMLRVRIGNVIGSANHTAESFANAIEQQNEGVVAIQYQVDAKTKDVTLAIQHDVGVTLDKATLETSIGNELPLGIVLAGDTKSTVVIDKHSIDIAYTIAKPNNNFGLSIDITAKYGVLNLTALTDQITDYFKNNTVFYINQEVTQGRILEIITRLIPDFYADSVKFIDKSTKAPATTDNLPAKLTEYYTFDQVTLNT